MTFATQQDNSVLLDDERNTNVGTMRNVSKQVYVRLAHGQGPVLRCTLVHLAEYFGRAASKCRNQLPERPFTFGF